MPGRRRRKSHIRPGYEQPKKGLLRQRKREERSGKPEVFVSRRLADIRPKEPELKHTPDDVRRALKRYCDDHPYGLKCGLRGHACETGCGFSYPYRQIKLAAYKDRTVISELERTGFLI